MLVSLTVSMLSGKNVHRPFPDYPNVLFTLTRNILLPHPVHMTSLLLICTCFDFVAHFHAWKELACKIGTYNTVAYHGPMYCTRLYTNHKYKMRVSPKLLK